MVSDPLLLSGQSTLCLVQPLLIPLKHGLLWHGCRLFPLVESSVSNANREETVKGTKYGNTDETTYTVTLSFKGKKQLEAFVNATDVIGSGNFMLEPNFETDKNSTLLLSKRHGGDTYEVIRDVFIKSSSIAQDKQINKCLNEAN